MIVKNHEITFRRRVDALPILNGPLEHVGELRLVAKKVWPHKVDHAPVLHEIVLERVACKLELVR